MNSANTTYYCSDTSRSSTYARQYGCGCCRSWGDSLTLNEKSPFLHKLWNVRGPELFLSNRPSLAFFRPLTSQANQEFCWQWNILNLTTPRKTFWRIAFYFGWPNCTLPMAAPCAVSHSLLKRLHFYVQIIHHCLDLFPPFFTFHTFGVLCRDLRWGGRKKSGSLFFLWAIVETP